MSLLLQLFFVFLQIGACSIGGGYATISMIQQYVVLTHGWLDNQEFIDMITLSQMTPGPLAINTSTFAGMRTAGFGGAVLATIGCILCGLFISILLYLFFQRYQTNKKIAYALSGLKSISLGLIMSSAMTIFSLAFLDQHDSASYVEYDAVIILIITLFCMRRWKISAVYSLCLAGCIGFLFSLL